MKCPHCDIAIENVVAYTMIPDEQKMVLSIKHEPHGFSAKTLGAMITTMDKLLKAVAKDIGQRVSVFVTEIDHDDNEVNVTFVITLAKGQP